MNEQSQFCSDATLELAAHAWFEPWVPTGDTEENSSGRHTEEKKLSWRL